ncbi:MAG: phenylalanine--tRNA ligase subunit beta [Roseiflexaceae bacterium]
MRVPLSWLREFVDITLEPNDLAELLTRSGLEVSAIDRIGMPGGELPWDPEKILICNILEVKQHPNADKLVLATVDYGAAAAHTVVTGAPNLYPFRDQGPIPHPLKSVFAREGAELYDGHAEGKVKVKLKGRPVRGVMSDAMLCSEKELGLSDEHEGILFLPEDAPVGTPLRDYLGDVVIEIDILPNTARCLSILGVAREVAALTGATLRMPTPTIAATGPSIMGRANITIEEPELCPRFTATLIEGVQGGQSPLWMQRRLIMAGMRPISTIVDISNYVMLELGQPNHTFDADKVADQHLIVRKAHDGEQLKTLDGKVHTLTPDRLLVCDPQGGLSLAGVMGGESSEVSESTTRILLEMAVWEPTSIRRTAGLLKMRSEASRRFERGVDIGILPLAQQRALSLIQQFAGGTIAAGMLDSNPTPWSDPQITLTGAEVRRILGLSLSAEDVAGYLEPLGFGCRVLEGGVDGAVLVTVPSFRADVSHTADLCEEVARMYGYDRLPTTLLADELPPQRANLPVEREQKVRDLLVGAGLDEAITYSLTNMASVAKLDPAAADSALFLRLANPLTAEREFMRRSVLPTLLEALAQNMNERERTQLFEIGRVYLRREDQILPDEPRRLALALSGLRSARSWLGGNEAIDFFDLKGMIELVLERLGVSNRVRFVPLTNDPRFHPGRAATLELLPAQAQRGGKGQPAVSGQPVGVLGELHPEVSERFEIKKARVLAAEIDLDPLLDATQPARYSSISRFPAITQDLSILVALDVSADRVASTIRKYAGNELEALTLIDVYQGERIEVGKRSMTYSLTFRAKERTLSDTDLVKTRAKIVKGLEFDVGATLRG